MAQAIGQAFLKEFDEEMATTRKTLASVPEEKFGWKPHAKSFSMQALAGHVAEIPSWATEVLTRERFDVTQENQPENTNYLPATKQQMLERFDDWVKKARADMATASDEAMQQEWVMTWSGYEMIRMPRRDAIRKWVLNHGVHHRAQLGVYLRLNDVPVPGAYGPSADEQS